jgi:hypothetical protein
MDELVKLVSKKVGISDAQARQAVETVVGFLKTRLPDPLADQVENLLEGGEGLDLDDLTKNLGGLLGNR